MVVVFIVSVSVKISVVQFILQSTGSMQNVRIIGIVVPLARDCYPTKFEPLVHLALTLPLHKRGERDTFNKSDVEINIR
jgi:hypothetical protein